ncbi:5262_t:CDS:2 [Gigaspora rosea]|nr:5262_t:CDS:2 [Gigaspora rosea]
MQNPVIWRGNSCWEATVDPKPGNTQGTAGGAKAALQQHVKRHVDGKNPRDKNSSILKSLKGASFLRSRHTRLSWWLLWPPLSKKTGMGNRQPRHLDETLRVSDAAVHRLNGSWWAQYATFGRSRILSQQGVRNEEGLHLRKRRLHPGIISNTLEG